MMNFDLLLLTLRDAGFSDWGQELELRQPDWLIDHGNYERWTKALKQLPEIN